MNIVFHIPRMNWFRVLSPLIEETLRRGHKVECWLHSGARTLGENCPNRLKVPTFRSAQPTIIEYEKAEEIIRLVKGRSPDVVIDLYPPRFPEIQHGQDQKGDQPFWLLVDIPAGCGIIEIQSEGEMYGCDAFAICNSYYLDSSIQYCVQDKQVLLLSLKTQESIIGAGPAGWVSRRFMYQPGDAPLRYMREHSILLGNPALDEYPNIDRTAIRKRLKISDEQRIIALLPFPFGYDQTSPWEQMFGRSLLKRLLWIVKAKRFDYLSRSFILPSNTAVLRTLRRFALNNNALLIAKLRHSRKPQTDLAKYCHMMIGEEGYFPHTAAELFSVADLVVGYYSTGSIEAVALGTPYLNIEIPGFPKKYYCDTSASILCCDSWPGVVWSMSAQDVIHELSQHMLQEFKIQTHQREKYLQKFANWPLGNASSRILEFLEKRVSA